MTENQTQAEQVKKPTRRPIWKRLGIAIFSLLLLLAILVYTLLYTSLGMKVTTYALNKWLPELKIAQLDGTLHDFTLKGFDLELPGVSVKIDDAALSLSGLCLLKVQACIEQFNANGVNVMINTNQLSPSEPEAESQSVLAERSLIKMPLPIKLNATHLTRVKVQVDDMQFGLSDFQGNAKWIAEKLYVYPSIAQNLSAIFADNPAPNNHIAQTSSNVAQPDVPINQLINNIFNQPLITTLPQVSIPLDINVESLTGDNWFLHIAGDDYHFRHVIIKNNMENNHIMVERVETDAQTPYATGHVIVNGDMVLGDDWPLSANVNIKTAQDQLTGQFSGKLLGELATQSKITGINQANIKASINFIEKYMPVKIDTTGKHLQWPLNGKPQYQLNDFTIKTSGSVQQYQLTLKGAFKGENLPDTLFDVLGNGTTEMAHFDHAIAKFPQGEINLNGQMSWVNALKWDLLVKINHVDLTKELPAYPIKLTGDIQTSGTFGSDKSGNDKWQIDISKLQLKGNIKRAEFTSTGALSANSDHLISANKLAIIWGKNEVNLNGSTEKGNLTSQLKLNNLALLLNEIQGAINGEIKMNGTLTKPTVDANLAITNFTWQDISINRANLIAALHYQDQLSGKISFVGQHMEVPNLTINNANIELTGNENSHTLTVDINGVPVSLKSTLTGHLDNDHKKWTGAIPETVLFTDNPIAANSTSDKKTAATQNSWRLAKTLPLSYDLDKQTATIGAHCWLNSAANSNASICLDQPFTDAANHETTLSLNHIDLATLPLPNDGETKLAGKIDGKATIRATADSKIPTIKLNITSHDVYIKQMLASQTLPIPFDIFNIHFDMNERQAKLDWNFSLKDLGNVTGNLIIDDPTGQKRLNGRLVIDNLALALLNPLLESDEYAKGSINGNVKFAGTLLDPYITGAIELKQSEIKASQLPADIKSAIMTIEFHGKSSTLRGILTTKAGDINIDGKASWRTINDWRASLTVKGAAMEVSLPPMIVMTVIPDIKIEANPKELSLQGKVDIPKGKITVETMPPSTVDVSSDEVMLDKNHQEVKPDQLGMNIKTDLIITIGNKVLVDAFGLKASLTGNLQVLQENKGLEVHGQIVVPQGRFRAYGQDLIIRKGEITFAGPADQPALDVEAIRNPESMDGTVTAGIRVTGTADDPKIEIFSDPAMSQQEALSYLLRGQGLDSGEQSDNDMMTAMLVGLGTAKSGQFIGDVGSLFGIKNLTLDTQGAGNSSKVVVSGYLLPNLQLKYGVGIFDSLATFTLRYRLMPRLYLEAASGLAQTLDLIYQLEF
ncbi:translocation/assembly module TamB [Orbaceae bacterium ESL0727]|nr:translocation/assembly module TamB [Orbaceae bacterium ESL0727]